MVQPVRLRDPEWPRRLAEFGADVAVVVAFGQILPKAVLQVPARGSINVHASLLPRYRGAAPIAWALVRGERETGITTFQMDAGMDTGGILLQRATPIDPEETAGELSDRLSRLGAEVIVETLDRLDTLTPTAQDHAAATSAPGSENAPKAATIPTVPPSEKCPTWPAEMATSRQPGASCRTPAPAAATPVSTAKSSRNESQCAGVPTIASTDAPVARAHDCHRSGRIDTAGGRATLTPR